MHEELETLQKSLRIPFVFITHDQGEALSMATATKLRYGCIWINTNFMLVNETPHGGLKQSGYGKDMSISVLEDYTAVRNALVKHG